MKRTLSAVTSIIGALSIAVLATSCAAGPPSSALSSAAAASPVTDETVIIDVRTAAEYAEGHLAGAVKLDLNGGEFAAALPELDPSAEYVVYCRSGNRSGQAVALMEGAGFTQVTNLGSLEEAAAATGIDIVR